jgi:uncharacterized protein YbjT (DUF2867 family)
VTGALGRTGSVAALELLERGFPVRALVRRLDGRAERLRQAGAEIVVGDLFDFRDLQRALVDVQRAYHCPPFAPNLLHGATAFALAAEEAKLEIVALMSGWNPHPAHPSALTREHWLANHVYRWMPSVDVIHINPGLFAFTYLLGLPAIVHFGMLMAPFGEGLNAPPSNEDIGRVVAAVLADPRDRLGRSYRPTGPELISPYHAAEVLTRVLGRKVKYQDAPPQMFAKAALAMGFPIFEVANIRHYAAELRGGTFEVGAPSGHVEELCGRPSEDFEVIARRYLAQPELIAPGLSAGSKASAVLFLVRMFLTRVPDLDAWEGLQGLPRIGSAQLAHENPIWRGHAEAKRLYLLSGQRDRAAEPRNERSVSA